MVMVMVITIAGVSKSRFWSDSIGDGHGGVGGDVGGDAAMMLAIIMISWWCCHDGDGVMVMIVKMVSVL